MRKKIGIFLGDVTNSIQEIVIHKIISHSNELGYDTAFICTYGSYNDDILYADAERAFINVADYGDFQGFIVAEDLLDIDGLKDELYLKLKKEAKCPVVYLRSIREGFYSVLTHNEDIMAELTRHFIVDHGFNDICFMSGKADCMDATERLNGFLKAMAEFNLPVNDNTIFYGDYWREKGAMALDFFMKGRTKYPQAIICANDYMALSVCDELRNRGIRVPEDVCVSGFDYVYEAKHHSPSITSVEVDFEDMAGQAVDIIDRVNKGEVVDKLHYHEAKIHYHNSCCGPQHDLGEISKIIEDSYLKSATTKQLMLSVTEYQDAVGDEEYLSVADKYHGIINTDKAFVCFCDIDEINSSEAENVSTLSEKMIIKRIFHRDRSADKVNIEFDRKLLLPDEVLSADEYNNYMFFCIHTKNKIYGYIAMQSPSQGWVDIFMQAYYINLANAIEKAILTQKIVDLEELKDLCFKDGLTGIYNRRGFDKFLREAFIKAKSDESNIAVVSIDMDDLKYLNDNFGHSEGDVALKGIANALSVAINEKEFCARVGGDEFAALLHIDEPSRVNKFRADFYKEIEKFNISGNANKQLGASFGVCELSENRDTTLMQLLNIADSRMYENKRSRKDMLLRGH